MSKKKNHGNRHLGFQIVLSNPEYKVPMLEMFKEITDGIQNMNKKQEIIKI